VQFGDDQPPKAGEVPIHFIKSAFFRVIHVDGAYGGTTPQGNIQMEVWSERQSIPRMITYEIDGNDVREMGRDDRGGFVREVEAGLVMDLATAEQLAEWLKNRIEILKQGQFELARGSGPESKSSPETKPAP